MNQFMDRRTVVRRTGATIALAGTAGCLGNGENGPQTIEMNQTSFSPSSTTVSAGTTVRWTNTSEIDHTVTAYEDTIPDDATYFASGGFDSEQAARNNVNEGLIAPGESYEHTFEVLGTYEYFCIPHESSGMIGTIRVK